MNKDIETLREAARLLAYDFKDMPDKLRAIADRMEQQSKAEPVAQVHILRSGAADFEQLQKIEDGSMLFTHQPADARDRVKEIINTTNAQPAQCAECQSKQAKIDALMLEYCPDEMTAEQKAEYAKHQKPAQEQGGEE